MENKVNDNSSSILNTNSVDNIINNLENMDGTNNNVVNTSVEDNFISVGAASTEVNNNSSVEDNFISVGASKTDEKVVVSTSIDVKDDATLRNEVEYQKIMDNVKNQHSNYYDINHPVVKGILFFMFGIGLFGMIYYVAMWFLNN